MAERPAGRRAAPAATGLAVAGLLAACGPAVVPGQAGGPFATTAPGPAASRSPNSPPPSSPPSSPPTPTPTPTVPPLTYDSISLNGSTLGFLSPAKTPGWAKTLYVGNSTLNRTYYDDPASGLHVTVEVDLPLPLTPLEHARELSLDKQTTEEGYRVLAVQPGPIGGATWAFTSTRSGPTSYVIDWFYDYPAFGAAILVQGPVAAKSLVKALWLDILGSAFVPTPYSTPTSSSGSGAAEPPESSGPDGPALPDHSDLPGSAGSPPGPEPTPG